MFCLKGIGGGSDDKKGKTKQEKEQENKMVTKIKRRNRRKMGAKEGGTELEISRVAGTNSPHPYPHSFVEPVCALTLILPWSHPTVTALTSTCLPVPSLKDTQGRERKEGGSEREGRRGDFYSQEN